jgi:hypothetical protein
MRRCGMQEVTLRFQGFKGEYTGGKRLVVVAYNDPSLSLCNVIMMGYALRPFKLYYVRQAFLHS